MATQFPTMSIAVQQPDIDTSVQQQYGDSGASASTTTSGSVYVSSVTQGGTTPRPIQYVMYPHPSQLPMQQMRPVIHSQPVPSHLVATAQQQVQQGSSPQQPAQAYVYATPPPYQQQLYYHHQYATTKDASSIQYPHSQTPPTPPRTSSPSLSGQPYGQQQMNYTSPPTQQSSMQYPQQTHTPPYPQQTPPQPPSQTMRPVGPLVVPAGRAVAIGTAGIPAGALSQAHVTHTPVQYQPGAVQVQTQYPSNQKRAYNVDRRQAKMSELYSHDGSFVPPVPMGYGETMGVVQGERSQYNQYAPQR